VLDNLVHSSSIALERVALLEFGTCILTDQRVQRRLLFYNVDLCDSARLSTIFSTHADKIYCVIHFASLKAVSDSCANPLEYWRNNFTCTLNLISCMEKLSLRKIIFSSSAAVYGNALAVPITELARVEPASPYGNTKLAIEALLKDMSLYSKWHVVILRYFNPIGNHSSGLIGDDQGTKPANIMPILANVVMKKRQNLTIFGNDYNTPDKTAVRDYIHVMDVAKGHISAMSKFNETSNFHIFNLGTGKGVSVLDLVNTYQTVTNIEIPHVFAERRPGDVPMLVADSTKAEKDLNWKAEKSLEDMCRDFHTWVTKNPSGYTNQ